MVEFINYWIGSAMDFAPSSGFSLTSNPHQPSLPLFPMDRNTLPLTKMLAIDKRLLRIASASCLVMASAAALQASDWTGTGPASGSLNWSTVYDGVTNTTGWVSSVPNSAGAVANFYTIGTSKSVTLDSPVTLGALNYSGSTGGTRTITMANALTLNNNGSGAVIANNTSATSSILSFSSGTFNLADNLRVVNTNTALNGSNNAITFGGSSVVQGTGNVTFSNAANTTNVAAINWGGNHTFTGSVLIEKGAVIYGSATTGFGNAANVITLGSAGNGSATMMSTASTPTLANKIIVAAGSGGTLLLGNNSASATNAIFSGTITLNGDVSLMSRRTGANSVRYTGVISGDGGITTVGDGVTQLGSGTSLTNTYKGSTTLSETSSLTLSTNAKMTFYIENSGVNNKITGVANNVLTLDGGFVFDLTGAAANGTWQIVDVSLLTETFSSTFGVYTPANVAWTEAANIWTYTNGSVTYSFSEATGVLTAVPEPTTALLLGGGLMVLLLRRRRS